jgi:hypothetical protein
MRPAEAGIPFAGGQTPRAGEVAPPAGRRPLVRLVRVVDRRLARMFESVSPW